MYGLKYSLDIRISQELSIVLKTIKSIVRKACKKRFILRKTLVA